MAKNLPPLYEKCLLVYTEMRRVAGDDDRFVGNKTQAIANVGVGTGWYSKVFYYLSEMGCIVEEKRGSRMTPSVVKLLRPPSLDDFNAVYEKHELTSRKSRATLQAEIETLARRLPDIDLPSYLVSLDARLEELEARLRRLEDTESKGGT